LNVIQSKGVTEIILHPLLHPDHPIICLFDRWSEMTGLWRFPSLLLSIQLLTRTELDAAAAENQVLS